MFCGRADYGITEMRNWWRKCWNPVTFITLSVGLPVPRIGIRNRLNQQCRFLLKMYWGKGPGGLVRDWSCARKGPTETDATGADSHRQRPKIGGSVTQRWGSFGQQGRLRLNSSRTSDPCRRRAHKVFLWLMSVCPCLTNCVINRNGS